MINYYKLRQYLIINNFILEFHFHVWLLVLCVIQTNYIVFIVNLQWTRQFRVSNEIYDACFLETKVWRNKTALFVQQIVPPNYDTIQEFF